LAGAQALQLQQKPEGQPEQARQSLRILELATKLPYPNHPTKAYRLRRAQYLQQLGDLRGAQDQRDLAARQLPVTALDYYLVGDQYYKQGNVLEAIRAFKGALRLERDHFWAQYFLSVCYLRPESPHPDLAQVELTYCLTKKPDLVWLYLMRGFAH